jgi:hypothetical protein
VASLVVFFVFMVSAIGCTPARAALRWLLRVVALGGMVGSALMAEFYFFI